MKPKYKLHDPVKSTLDGNQHLGNPYTPAATATLAHHSVPLFSV